MSKTFVACRPGFLQQAQAAFHGMEVEVDMNLTADYEFRQRELGLADLLEAELESEESEAVKKADPKNAHTFIVPLLGPDDTLEEEAQYITYLVVRIDKKDNKMAAGSAISALKPVLEHDDAVNIRGTTNALFSELKKGGFKVHSVSVANGLTLLGA